MSAEVNLINLLEHSIASHLKQVDKDAQRGRELVQVIADYLDTSRSLFIWERNTNEFVVSKPGVTNTKVFTSASYTACVEWALKQPVIGGSNE